MPMDFEVVRIALTSPTDYLPPPHLDTVTGFHSTDTVTGGHSWISGK